MQIEWTNAALAPLLDYDIQEERCGLLFGTVRYGDFFSVKKIVELTNYSDEPEEFFALDGDEVRQADAEVPLLGLGYWHTHLEQHSPEPSPYDLESMAQYPGHIALVYHWPSGRLTWFNHAGIIKQDEYYW